MLNSPSQGRKTYSIHFTRRPMRLYARKYWGNLFRTEVYASLINPSLIKIHSAPSRFTLRGAPTQAKGKRSLQKLVKLRTGTI